MKLLGAVCCAMALLAMTATPLPAQSARASRVAYITGPTDENKVYVDTFRVALRDRGLVEGANLALDIRYTDRELAELERIVADVVRLKPDVIVAWESVAQAIRAKTTTIPIVLAGAIDPVASGLAKSLRHPGLNVTGTAQLNDELAGKHVEIMRMIRPTIRRIGLLVDRSARGCQVVESGTHEAARRFSATVIPYYITDRATIEAAFTQMAKSPPDMLMPCPSPVLFNFRDLLFENVLRLRIPFTSFVPTNVPDGVLFAYAATYNETVRTAALYVERILNGAKPETLPIELPTRFQLVLNLRTAKILQLTIPPSVVVRADHVIE
jgi:putative ABC transport system substrate-binding protein